MTTTPTRAAFTTAEHRARLARAREAIRAAGLDACVCVAPEHLYYLGGYDAHTQFSSQALVFGPGDDEPTLVMRELDRELARESSWLSDVRTYHYGSDDPAAVIAEVVRERAGGAATVGLDLQSYALPGSFALALIGALAPAKVVDATDVIGSLRLVKSDAEMAYLRQAARYAEIGMEAARDTLRVGITETAWASRMETAMRDAGSDYFAMPTWVASGPRTVSAHATPTDRVIQQGEMVHVELCGVARRYHVLSLQTMAAGEPSARGRELYDAAIESLAAGEKACAVGVPVAAVEEAALEPLRRRGLERYFMGRFGYGISAAYPPSWLEPLHIIRESDQVLEAGMVFILHTNLDLADEGVGMLTGGTYALTAEGLETLAGGTPALFIG